MKSTARLTIGALADRFGLATHVLRHWEAAGLLVPDARVNGRRYYTEEQAVRIATILRGKRAGLRLDQLRDVLTAPSGADRRELLRRHYDELDRRIRELTQSRAMIEHAMRCQADDFTRCPAYQRMVAEASAPITR
ncbi:MerR family transcriptional regulator [Jiangella rhizosphaerae]|uniref:MerR family transcriptional regulator n=1 Tax=Jiangella rhizosphaerae TaxID=2293569 RepID=A0A418KH74_9ACTN|nr:MerR family transcriptional regulator [Jiangella rhizosphaerae]RIQ11591.1 MerR family transcriptional regulator [Jiangella rhizosphaerae]